MKTRGRIGRQATRLALGGLLALATAPALSQAGDAPPLGEADGEQVYRQLCQGCHMPDGRGATGGGAYPAFVGNPNLASARYLAVVVLNGRRNMPAFRRPERQEFFFPPTWLTDAQVAGVVNYLRREFGGITDAPITAEEITRLQTSP